MISNIVEFARQNSQYDIFKITTIDTLAHTTTSRFVEYPRSMSIGIDEVYDLEVE